MRLLIPIHQLSVKGLPSGALDMHIADQRPHLGVGVIIGCVCLDARFDIVEGVKLLGVKTFFKGPDYTLLYLNLK